MTPSQELKLLREALAVAEAALESIWKDSDPPNWVADDALSRITTLKAQASEKPTRKARVFYLVDATDNSGWHVRTSTLGIIGCNTIKVREVLSDESEASDE